MQDQLTERQKECLRELVKLVREGTIPEEFVVTYALEKSAVLRKDRHMVEAAETSA